MSVQVVRYLRCDGCGLPASVDMADEGATVAQQRQEARKELGWIKRNGDDLCESCGGQEGDRT